MLNIDKSVNLFTAFQSVVEEQSPNNAVLLSVLLFLAKHRMENLPTHNEEEVLTKELFLSLLDNYYHNCISMVKQMDREEISKN